MESQAEVKLGKRRTPTIDECQEDDAGNTTLGRWSKEEHEKFITGKSAVLYNPLLIAITLYGKDWK
jgi:hypothetical protein